MQCDGAENLTLRFNESIHFFRAVDLDMGDEG
jgi:hypothetical protein